MNGNVKKIIFLNSVYEAEAYTSRAGFNNTSGRDELFIALNPNVYSYLRRKGLSVRDTTAYFSNNSHVALLEKSRILMGWLRKNSEFVDMGLGVKDAYREIFIFWTRFAVHTYLRYIEIALNAISLHGPSVVAAPFSGAKGVSSLYVEPEEKCLGYFVNAAAAEKAIDFQDIPISGQTGKGHVLNRIELMRAVLKYLYNRIRFSLRGREIALNNLFKRKNSVFLTSKFYNMKRLSDDIQGDLPRARVSILRDMFIPPPGLPAFLTLLGNGRCKGYAAGQRAFFDKLLALLESNPGLFSYGGIPFSKTLAEKIRKNIIDFMLGAMGWSVRLEKFMDITSPAVFISSGNRLEDIMLAEMCQNADKTAVIISHGSHVRPKSDPEIIEWGEHGRFFLRAPFSHIALQSPTAEGYLDTFKTQSAILKTGPLIWGMPVIPERGRTILEKMFKSKHRFDGMKVLLHAGTPKPNNSMRFYVYETTDEYIQALRDIAQAVEGMQNTMLIIKFRPSPEISVDALRNLVPFSDKVILSVNEPFLDILGIADLLASFSSTTIEEALQNRIPVLLYGGGGRYQHLEAFDIGQDAEALPSAVYCVKEAAALRHAIKDILSLNIRSEGFRHLFDPYIYAGTARRGLVDILR